MNMNTVILQKLAYEHCQTILQKLAHEQSDILTKTHEHGQTILQKLAYEHEHSKMIVHKVTYIVILQTLE